MGQSTDGILAFGWNLGSDGDPEWAADLVERLTEADDDVDDLVLEVTGAELPPNPWDELEGKPHSWFYEDPQGKYGRGESEQYRSWKQANEKAQSAYYAARREALAAVPWRLERHCSGDYPMWLLTLRDLYWSASRGYAEDVGEVLVRLGDAQLHDRADELWDAARMLGLEPPEPPRLLLCSYWG